MKQLEELLSLLEEQTGLLRSKLSLLQEMTESMRRGELEELGRLLTQEGDLAGQLQALDQRTQQIRRHLAGELGVDARELTLSRLVQELEQPQALALDDRRERLALAVEQLQEGASRAGRLVRFALEFNNELLAALVGTEEQAATYSVSGAVEQNCDGATFHRTA